MVKHRPRPPVGSLNSMASKVRDQRAASTHKLPGAGSLQAAKPTKELSDDDSNSGSDDDSSSDSDGSGSDGDLEAARKKYAAKQASKQKDAKTKSNSAKSEPAKTTSTANAKVPTKSSPDVATAKADDSGSESDTSSEDSDSSDSPAQGAAVKEAKKAESSSDSESDSESSGESEDEDEKAGAQAKTKQPAEAESSSDDESDSEESSHEEAHAMDVDSNGKAVSTVNGNTVAEESTSQVSRPAWLNNTNFVLRKASSDNPARDVANFFNKTNLEGKQVWYFTAPASLPITVLQDMEIDLSKATTGEALLNHKGDSYGLDIESHATSTQIQLLIPSQGGDKYTSLNRGIDSTVHLRRIANFGPNGAISTTATDNYIPIPKAIREQPQGLRPRFTPIGVPNPILPQVQISKPQSTPEQDDSSESDSDEEKTTVPQSQLPASSGSSKKAKKSEAANGNLKRKHAGDENKSTPIQQSQSQEKTAKKPKTTKSTTTKAPTPNKGIPTQSHTPIIPPSHLNGATPNVKMPSNKEKAKKEKKYTPIVTKQTPVPLPSIPSMKR